jgi:hypothetical protein
MNNNDSKVKQFFRSLLLVIGFIGFIFMSFWLSWQYFEKQAEADVSSMNPTYFPIVAITSDKSKVIMFDEIDSIKKEFPNFTFLVPNDKADLIDKQLQADQKERGGKGIPRIKATEIGEGKQLVEFEIMGDGLYVSRYEAAEKTVKPLTFKLAGPGFIFLPCGTTFIVGFIGFIFLRAILWFLKRRQKVL